MNMLPERCIPAALRRRIANLADQARLARPVEIPPDQEQELIAKIKEQLRRRNAVLIAHYYVDGKLQDLAEETGGFVADSLEMARFGHQHPAKTLVVAGVRFMGETAKILSPDKRVLVPDVQADCSLDLGCPEEAFLAACDAHPDRTVVVYANTSAAVKARADWTVTSAIGRDIVAHLAARGKKVLWAPDRYLGGYIQRVTGADMLLWPGSCVVHEEFKADALRSLLEEHPDAAVLVHPESPPEVVALADVVGSTTQMIRAARELPATTLIVATEQGIFHKMKQTAPGKTFLPVPTGGLSGTCASCATCPWMKLNDLAGLARVLETGENEIQVPEPVRSKAVLSIQRMLDFSALRPTRGSQRT